MRPPQDGGGDVWLLTLELDLMKYDRPEEVCTALALARRLGNLEVINPLSDELHYIRLESTGEVLSVRRRSPQCPFYRLSLQVPLHVSSCVVSSSKATATLLCGRAALSSLKQRLDALGAPYRVLRARKLRAGRELGASRKQWMALLAAFQMGYFDTPSRASLREVAAALGKSPSTVSELLKRALRNILANELLRLQEKQLEARSS